MAVVFFNIGWMRYYKGQTHSDRIVNGGEYVATNKTGHEVKNFLPIGNFLYGYVRPSANTINIAKLGAEPSAKYADDVTIVFTATRPSGGSVVVGWYLDARVWSHERRDKGRIYFARANRDNCTLLEVDQRGFPVPRAGHPKGTWGIGQSNIRYVEEKDETENFIRDLRRLLEDPSKTVDPPPKSKDLPRQSDPDRRVKVEKAAIDCVTKHYEGYSCMSVERDNKGWDLEISRGAVHLLVEVKGCSGDAAVVELTPNEYKAMCRKRHQYRLAIVTNALDKPRLSIVSFNGSDDTWRDQDNRRIRLTERTGARITCD